MTTASVSIGVAGALGPAAIARIATAVEAAGFHALWVNDTPGADSLAAIAAAAAVTDRLVLATGVVPVDRRSPAEILAAARDLPADRIVIGIGSGGTRTGAVALVHDAIGRLRGGTTARILVGSLGPRMRRLAAAEADGPLLSWLTPAIAAAQASEAHEERLLAHVTLYVRAAIEVAAADRLARETAQYASYPSYAANFARLGIDATATTLHPDSFDAGLEAYRAAVDEVVLRAITPGGTTDEAIAFVEAAAARMPAA
jgi:alkanesulfonate monooxygenase SsuD/methylene tetrahydromethanopterin reductase-like flavin-dependent oxidoreductase (luciferase family)